MVDEVEKTKIDPSRMSLERLKELCDEVFKDTNLEYSIANPLFGYMFKTDGCLENIRFFSSEIIAVYDENNSRDYSKDTSENSLTSLVILLFPSPLGVLNSARNTLSNFTNKYFIDNKDYDETSSTDSRNKNIKMLANTFIKLYKDGTSNELKQPSTKKATPYKMFEYYVFAPSDVPGLENTNLKLLTIHAYALSVIDSTDEFRVYLETISEGLKDIENDRLECLVLSDQQKKEFKELYMNHSNFPYSKINQPVSNSSIPVYNRQTDEFSKTQKFSDCTDIVILHLCNCLFYNEQTGECSLANLKSESNISDECTRLIEFYEKYNNKPFNITYEMRMDWSRVVQGLSDNEAFEYQAEYKPYAIRYINDKDRNELVSGTINIMSVLTKICNIEKIYKNVMAENAVMMYSLGKKLSYLFNKISSDHIEIVKIKGDEIRWFVYRGIEDFSGTYEITFKLAPSADSVKMLLELQNGEDTAFKFVSMETKKRSNSLKRLGVKTGDITLRSLLNRYVKMVNDTDQKTENYDFALEILYNQGLLQTDGQKREQLICLYEYIDRQDNIDHSVIKRTIANIVKSANLSDPATRKLFIPFFICIDDLLCSLDESEIFDIWIELYCKDAAIKSEVIRSLWNEERILKKMEVTKLRLSRSKITIEDMKTLIYHTRLELKDLQMSFLYEDSDELVDLVKSMLSQSSNICKLDISKNLARTKCVADILKMLKNNNSIRTLDISWNNITNDCAEHIANFLMANNMLNDLNVGDNRLEDKGIKQILNVLKTRKSNFALDISKNELKDIGVKYISDALKSEHCLLNDLNISRNDITEKGFKYLTDALKVNKTLTTLNISSNKMTEEDVKHISEALMINETLTDLYCSSCSITETGAKYFSEALKVNTKLVKLDFSCNSLTAVQIRLISEAIKVNTTLTNLDISNNPFKDLGAKYISEALKINQSLEILNISTCEMTELGLKYILDALKENKSLKALDISTDSGLFSYDEKDLKLICEFLKTNKSLNEIRISYAKFTDLGASFISDMLNTNQTLQHSDIADIPIYDDSQFKILADALRINKSLTEISIRTGNLEADGLQVLSNAIKENTTLKSLKVIFIHLLLGNRHLEQNLKILSRKNL